MEESSAVISETPPLKTNFISDIINNNTYVYILIAVLIICCIVYFMYNKTFNDIGHFFNIKKQEQPPLIEQPPIIQRGATYYINDINGNKISVSGTLIESSKEIIKPKIIHPQKEIINMNFDDIQIDEDDKTRSYNLTNSEMIEIHQKLENIE